MSLAQSRHPQVQGLPRSDKSHGQHCCPVKEPMMEKAIRFEKPHEVHTAVGKEICVTDWVTVDQQRIDKFAEATGDFQWIHVDVERAKASPYGGTIAHGFLTLSLVGGFYEPYLQHAFPFCDLGLNYGL